MEEGNQEFRVFDPGTKSVMSTLPWLLCHPAFLPDSTAVLIFPVAHWYLPHTHCVSHLGKEEGWNLLE